ncbi:MAG: transposase family protein [Gammaproteobacteria bacterium]|nr:transposase family protein [Gammaproteobacteria bacterium]
MCAKAIPGYPCRRWLLTPHPNPISEEEKLYNYCQASTRAIVENSFGWLKRRFAILHGENRLKVCGFLTQPACFYQRLFVDDPSLSISFYRVLFFRLHNLFFE